MNKPIFNNSNATKYLLVPNKVFFSNIVCYSRIYQASLGQFYQFYLNWPNRIFLCVELKTNEIIGCKNHRKLVLK